MLRIGGIIGSKRDLARGREARCASRSGSSSRSRTAATLCEASGSWPRCCSSRGRSTRPSSTRCGRSRRSARRTSARRRRRGDRWRSIRAAQGRDEEAEALLRESIEIARAERVHALPRRPARVDHRVPRGARSRRRGGRVRGAARGARADAMPEAEPPGSPNVVRDRSRRRERRATAWSTPRPGDSLITVAGRSKRASASPSGSARSVPSP